MNVRTPSETDLPRIEGAIPEPPRRVLASHEPRSKTTVHGAPAALFGSIFVAAGALIVLCALNVIPTDDADFNVSRELVAVIGGTFFALPGASLVLHGLVGIVAQRRRDRARVVEAPWRWDHAWSQDGEQHSGFGPFRSRVLGIVGISLFLVPFHWLGFEIDWPWPLRIGLGFFDMIIAVAIGDAFLRLARALRYGSSSLRYDHFPYHPGDSIGLRFSLARPREFGSLRFTLRYVEEAYETHGTGQNRTQRVVRYAAHEQVHVLNREEASWVRGSDVAVAFSIPPDAPGTALSERPPRYWEVHVSGETIGPDLDEVFLVPIYARSPVVGPRRN